MPMDNVAQLNSMLAGRYVIERELGRGGMATVYLAHDLRHQRPVAVKVLDPELGAVLGAERFLAEIRVTATLQHPNLLPLFDSGDADGRLYYVMPYVEGETLRRRLDRERQLPVDEAVRIAVSIAGALDYAHRHGVIHRDLKPENVLLHEGQPLVADFGIALAVSNAGGQRVTQTGLSLGTPQYMSPEQATGDRVIDGRSDVYSLGAVLYEMLTGDPPHFAGTAQAVVAKVLTEAAPDVRALRPTTPPSVAASVARALEKLPADRFATGRELAESLTQPSEAWTRDTTAPSSGGRTAPRVRGLRGRRENRLFLALAGCAALGAAAAIGEGTWIATHPDTPARQAVRFELMLGDAHIANTSYPVIAISPDGRQIALAATVGGARRLYIRSLDNLTPRPVAGTEDGTQPIFSPDGKWLAFISQDRLRKVLVDGGPVVTLTDSGAVHAGGGSTWSASGVIVATGRDASSGRTGLVAVPEAGGAAQLVSADAASALDASPRPASGAMPTIAHLPLALPDGEHVLYSIAVQHGDHGDTRIAVMSLRTRRTTWLDLRGTMPLGVTEGMLVYVAASGTIMAVPFNERESRVTGTPTPLVEHVYVSANNGAARAALSTSGSLVFQRAPEGQLVLADTRRGARLLLPQLRGYESPRFSPDGKRVVVAVQDGVQRDLWIADVASGMVTRLTSGLPGASPVWTPDGRRIAFSTTRRAPPGFWWAPSDASAPAEPFLVTGAVVQFGGVFTPDGRIFIYTASDLPSRRIELLYRRVDGTDTTTHTLVSDGFFNTAPTLSPDGRWLAYASNVSGAVQVYVRPFPGPGPRVQVSVDGGGSPVWSRDGTQIFYAGTKQLLSAVVVTSPTFAVTSRRVVFDGGYAFEGFDVSPDGTQFLLLKSSASGSPIVMVHDWVAELRARRTGR